MDPKTYREEMLAKMRGVESAESSAVARDGRAGLDDVDALMAKAKDQKAPVQERVQAIEEINRIAFDLKEFRKHNADYLKVLKELRTDKSSKVRSAAFERLSLAMDHETRNMLQHSLSGEGTSLVPDMMAATLLGMDDHASSRDVLREAVEKGDKTVRRAALQGLASDSRSADVLERIATDQNEEAEMREAATLSLKTASPKRFADMVQKIVVDPAEDDRLRATALSSLAHSTDALNRVKSKSFLSRLDEVSKETRSQALKASIKHLQSRSE